MCSSVIFKARVTVTDNAGGIAEKAIGKIFDLYFTTNGATGGTGIGLYMAKSIIEKHMKGILSVTNVGEGAPFRIEITTPGKFQARERLAPDQAH